MAQKYFETHTDLQCRVFAGVGSYEFEKVANVMKFGQYLQANPYKSLRYKTVIVPDVAHGAGLGPVMQSAMKFAYCRTHTAISVPENQMKKYSGDYRSDEMPTLKLRFFVKHGNLYFKVGDIKTVRYLPYAKDKFFMVEDEKVEVSFKHEGGKKFMLFNTLNEKSQRIDKIN